MTPLTIKDIAQLAGVGVSTVSRALNNYPDVNEETKQKILAIVEKYNYSPNQNAKILKQNATNNVSIVVKGSANPFFEVIIERMQQDLEKHGYNALVNYIDERSDVISEASKLNVEKKLEGIIFLGGTAGRFEKELTKFRIPCVVSTVYVPLPPDCNKACVCVDDRAAAAMAMDYLVENGHRHIAIIGGERGNRDGIDLRFEGAMESLRKHGIEFDERFYAESKFSLSDAYSAMSRLLFPGTPITAVLAMSDIMAIGAAKAITDSGLKIPDDISIIGYDGIDMAYFYNPTLATIKQPANELARISVDILIRLINGEKIESNQIQLETEMIKGCSVKRI